MGTSEKITVLEVRVMSENSKMVVTKAWHTAATGRNILGENDTTKEVEQESE